MARCERRGKGERKGFCEILKRDDVKRCGDVKEDSVKEEEG